MSFSLSAPPPPVAPSSRRQRAILLAASALVHLAVLLPVALNTVSLPRFEDNGSFEVWLDLQRDVVPVERTPPVVETKPLPTPTDQSEETPSEQVEEQEREQQQQIIEQIIAATPQLTDTRLSATLPELVEQPPQPSEHLSTAPDSGVASLSNVDLPSLAPSISRPVIEAIDGPAAANARVSPLAGSSLPNLQPADQAGSTSEASEGAPDAPIPRRARLDAEAEAALAAAARGGALDDAWTYRPEAGGGAGAAGDAAGGLGDPMDGRQGLDGNTATRTGRIYYGQGTTPVDCTQPQLLSDIQRLSCDSAEQRRIRQAIERGVRVQGTGDATRDGQLEALGARRMEDHEARRRVSGGVGVSQGSMMGGSGQGEILDEMSGTNRDIRKLQEQIGASNGPRAPSPDND